MPDDAPIRLQLTEVRLERFKAAFKPKKPIEFGAFNVIIGRNGSGKSTVLEALQWIDAALRNNVRQACDPYRGVHDLVNIRSRSKKVYFRVELQWNHINETGSGVDYGLKIRETDGKPDIAEESLSLFDDNGQHQLIRTENNTRYICPSWQKQPIPFSLPDRLGLTAALVSLRPPMDLASRTIDSLLSFWNNAVFLRLNPLAIAAGSDKDRASSDPLLDQEGRLLPALLGELSPTQLSELARAIHRILPDMRGVEVVEPAGRGAKASFSLFERMPSRGRTGRRQFRVPAWMLSEGTRRITAILSLLQHDPPPSLLCIEEIENGLDPWSVKAVLNELRSASSQGVQVILTTHSPWLLNHVDVADILQVERSEGDTLYSRFKDKDTVKAYIDHVPPGAIYVSE